MRGARLNKKLKVRCVIPRCRSARRGEGRGEQKRKSLVLDSWAPGLGLLALAAWWWYKRLKFNKRRGLGRYDLVAKPTQIPKKEQKNRLKKGEFVLRGPYIQPFASL